MKKICKLCLLLGLVICLYYYAVVEAVDCSNTAVYCRDYTTYLGCDIRNNDTELVKSLIKTCSSESTRTELYYIHMYKDYYSTIYGHLIIDIDLPSNILTLYISNNIDQDYIRLTTSVQNIGLTRITTSDHVEIESQNFFNNFLSLQFLDLRYIISKETPSFTSLQYLTVLLARIIIGSGSHTFDNTMVRGLSSLSHLSLTLSNFDRITGDAFDNMSMLTHLGLGSNRISIIEDGAFNDLSSLRSLNLRNNEIKMIPDNIFENLHDLTYLYLTENPGFPIITLLHARSLVYLFLDYNGYQTLGSYIFQQMNSLLYLYLDNPFICGCDLQWVSHVSQYGLTIYGFCSEPMSFLSITSPQLYTNCPQTESYECFNKSITCPSNEVCHNTEDSYICGCPIGYVQNSTGECKDFDECTEVTNCSYDCQNTEGSYHCVCEDGYKVAINGYDCDDVNECQEGNGGCEVGCGNTIGSYQCYCEQGHQLYNETHCESDIQCDVVDSSGYEENSFVCQGGFNLTITNLTCQIIPDPTSPSTTELPTHCPIGYSLHNSGECKDFDECDEETNCTYSCENTEGSYHCVCDEGYKLASNGYDCEDSNECQEWNGGCEFGCTNTIGSYHCYCEYGHQLINETHCEEGIECELMGESCINALESNYYCKGGFNLSIYNLSCPNVNQLATTDQPSVLSIQSEFVLNIPTIILLSMSLVSNVFLIFMFIALFIYFARKNNKMQSTLKANKPIEPQMYKGYCNNETIYDCMDESAAHPDELKNNSAVKSGPIEKKDPNLLTEIYPGNVQYEAV